MKIFIWKRPRSWKMYVVFSLLGIALLVAFAGFSLVFDKEESALALLDGKNINAEAALTPEESKKRLIEGNKRYIEHKLTDKDVSKDQRVQLKEQGQQPFAVIVGCSDSRVPPEIIFDQALGDLFVIRVAGNVADAVAMASVEYAVEHLHSPLIVVLGHENCGAVIAAVDSCCEAIENPEASPMTTLLSLIQPSVQKAQSEGVQEDLLYEASINKNIETVVGKLLNNTTLRPFVDQGKVEIVGAKYLLETGEVRFFD
ncbi:carbonic anhydrase [Heliorestis convoluta]|uniref:Carbonic anhydrase n=1 Tax=Heliorestis convoluta TaxID=356322 RepID=A0A5Q2MZW9_9FIRM|nr:carbonic anhydrase [Heliorestis convoluta]QGG48308.1 carbonic anhydrase family protein [Heliorestis convoluta]